MRFLGFIVLSLVCLGCQSRQTPQKPAPPPAKESSRPTDNDAKRNSPDDRFAFANVMRLYHGQTYAQTVEVMGEPDEFAIPPDNNEVTVFWFTGHGPFGKGVSDRAVEVAFLDGVVSRIILRNIESPRAPRRK